MIRPEARKLLWDWREVILGTGLLGLGLIWALDGHGYQPMIGTIAIVIGCASLALGWRKVRFPDGGGGPGMVEVTERQIAYLTGAGGAAVAIESLTRIEVLTGASGFVWVFTTATGDVLHIPGDARGAEAIFDALVSLDGINYDQAQQAARAPGSLAQTPDTFLIWQRNRRALH